MYSTVKRNTMPQESDVEIKLIPLGNELVATQISSTTIRGTLIIDSTLEKEELTELGEVIYNLIQEMEMQVPDDDDDTEKGN